MAYTKTNWQDLPNTTTPINATNLNHIEQGIKDNDDKLQGTTSMGGILTTGVRAYSSGDADVKVKGSTGHELTMYSNSAGSVGLYDLTHGEVLTIDSNGNKYLGGNWNVNGNINSQNYKNAVINSFSDTSSVSVANGGWGVIFVFATYKAGLIQLQGYGNTPYVHNILGALDELSFSWNGNVLTISGMNSWDHYTFIGSSTVDYIV